MQNLHQTIQVDTYWAPWPFSSANAKSQHEININTAKLRRSLASITNTLVHETVHVVDWLTNNAWNYTHDFNKDGQENTAPWRIGSIVEDMVK